MKLLFQRQICGHCSLPNFVLHVTSHADVKHHNYPSGGQVAAFGKGGVLHLLFRITGRRIAAFTLLQMCRLFYLKGATEDGRNSSKTARVGSGVLVMKMSSAP